MGGEGKGFEVIDLDNGSVKYVAAVGGGTTSVSIHAAATDNTYAYDLSSLLGKEVKVLTNTKTGNIRRPVRHRRQQGLYHQRGCHLPRTATRRTISSSATFPTS